MRHPAAFATVIAMSIVACQSNACSSAANSKPSAQHAAQLSPPRPPPEPALGPQTPVFPAPQSPSAQVSVPAGPGADARSALGTNVSDFQDWSAEWSTIDVFKQSRDWISGSVDAWETKVPLDLDEHGWVKSLKPGQIARALLFWGSQPYPAGDYTVLYEGEGKLEYFVNDNVISHAPGRDVLRADPKKGGIGIYITETNPKNYIRNIRVLHAGGACSQDVTVVCRSDAECGGRGRCDSFERIHNDLIFHPVFLSTLKPYSAVRFMNWMATNNSEQKHWKDRPKPDDVRWTTHGVPVETMVALANRMRMHPWFCMPHQADDEYVGNFAKYVSEHLAPGLRAHVEHSNEVWNGAFPGQHWYAAEQGKKLKDALVADRFGMQMQWHAHRSKQIFKLWSKAFGNDQDRLVRVMGGWAANVYTNERLLTFYDAHKVTDALAIAPYFHQGEIKPDETADQFFARMPALLKVSEEWIRANKQLTDKYKVELIAYEGGQHLVDFGNNDPKLNALLDAVNRDPRMKKAYLDYLSIWREVGGHLFVHYKNVEAYGPHGRWGTLEYMTQPLEAAPKRQAILEWTQKNPRWW